MIEPARLPPRHWSDVMKDLLWAVNLDPPLLPSDPICREARACLREHEKLKPEAVHPEIPPPKKLKRQTCGAVHESGVTCTRKTGHGGEHIHYHSSRNGGSPKHVKWTVEKEKP